MTASSLSPAQLTSRHRTAGLMRRRKSIRARIEGAEDMAGAYTALAEPNPIWAQLAAQANADAEAARAELAALEAVCEPAVGE